MPVKLVEDPSGNTIRFYDLDGQYVPAMPHIDPGKEVPKRPNLSCRDDDIMILTYQKAGTHWTWEVVNMLVTGEGQISTRHKGDSMLEAATDEMLTQLPSVRLLNTHLPPQFYPKELIQKKNKIIFVQRNPKDIFVSYFHHTKSIRLYESTVDWNGFFELCLSGTCEYGSWFDWTKQWEEFLSTHNDLPVLRLFYEDMKLDLPAEVEKLAKFLKVPCEASFRDTIAAKCGFKNLKSERPVTGIYQNMTIGDGHPMYRKGIIGDWKNHFTVAQSERFDEEYKKQMKGFSFMFERFM